MSAMTAYDIYDTDTYFPLMPDNHIADESNPNIVI